MNLIDQLESIARQLRQLQAELALQGELHLADAILGTASANFRLAKRLAAYELPVEAEGRTGCPTCGRAWSYDPAPVPVHQTDIPTDTRLAEAEFQYGGGW